MYTAPALSTQPLVPWDLRPPFPPLLLGDMEVHHLRDSFVFRVLALLLKTAISLAGINLRMPEFASSFLLNRKDVISRRLLCLFDGEQKGMGKEKTKREGQLRVKEKKGLQQT